MCVCEQVIVQHGGQVDESYSNRVTHVLCENQNSDVFHLVCPHSCLRITLIINYVHLTDVHVCMQWVSK